jgi:hypothetical protein
MSITREDDADLTFIVNHYRNLAGFDIDIAEVQRKVWKNEIERIKSSV